MPIVSWRRKNYGFSNATETVKPSVLCTGGVPEQDRPALRVPGMTRGRTKELRITYWVRLESEGPTRPRIQSRHEHRNQNFVTSEK